MISPLSSAAITALLDMFAYVTSLSASNPALLTTARTNALGEEPLSAPFTVVPFKSATDFTSFARKNEYG